MLLTNRRRFLLSLPALALLPRPLAAQPGTIKVRGINHVGLNVSDLKRSTEFYEALFGLPVRRQGDTIVRMQIGAGPHHLELLRAAEGAAPSIGHYCLGVEGFEVDRVVSALAAHGVEKADAVAPLKVRVTARPAGGSSIQFGDPDGLAVQLQDAAYCGGSGPAGAVCGPPDGPVRKALIPLKGYSHLTVFSA